MVGKRNIRKAACLHQGGRTSQETRCQSYQSVPVHVIFILFPFHLTRNMAINTSFYVAMPLLKLLYVLPLQAGDKLLKLHATEQWQQLLRESVRRLALLGQQVEDNSVYKVNEILSSAPVQS